MSHFVTIRTEIREREHLVGALRDLGLDFTEGQGLTVRGDARRGETADIVIRTGAAADIGLRWSGGVFEVVADWYRVEQTTALRRKQFLGELQRRYARRVVLDQAKAQNLVVEEERLENGDIVLLLSEREG
ncbi:MAG TPA: DUF1257 domain-containing protein [Planctomycetota bacterium]|jgi:hypothetical protein|nr:DUF1257 domain-containing protein [Planctomycetota bacterium]